MALANSSEWFTTLHAAFQDAEHLYLLMEYAPGGTLRSPMNREERGEGPPLDESEVKFYVASIILGIEEVHKQRYIHRCVFNLREDAHVLTRTIGLFHKGPQTRQRVT